MKRETKPCPFYGMPCEYVPMAEKADAAAARIERLEAALRPFADESVFSGPQHEFVTVKRGDCDIARAVLEEKP